MTDFLVGTGLAVAFVYGFVDVLSGFGVTRLLLRRAFRRVPPHLRGRVSVDCGEGRMSGDDVRSEMVWDPVQRVSLMRHWLSSDWCLLDEVERARRFRLKLDTGVLRSSLQLDAPGQRGPRE